VLCGQGSPITWTALHLQHHAHSDTLHDIHSPLKGFWNSVLLWPIKEHDHNLPSPKYLMRDQTILFAHKNYFFIWYSLIVVTAVINPLITIYFVLFPAGLSLIHANLFTNYLPHRYFPGNYRNYDTTDNSYNNKFISYYQWGEGLHNNHHQSMSNYNQAHKPGEFDIAAWVIKRVLQTS
jgi:stearoyl-CoA desaturase (delta-9 desaturase)